MASFSAKPTNDHNIFRFESISSKLQSASDHFAESDDRRFLYYNRNVVDGDDNEVVVDLDDDVETQRQIFLYFS